MSQVSESSKREPQKCVVVKGVAADFKKSTFVSLLKSFAIPFKTVFVDKNNFVIKLRKDDDASTVVNDLATLTLDSTKLVAKVHDVSEFSLKAPEQKDRPAATAPKKGNRKAQEKKDKPAPRDSSEPHKFVIKRPSDSAQKKVKPLTELVISNLPHYITEEDINSIVEQKYVSVKITVKENRGTIAVVRFSTEEEAKKAYTALKEDSVEVDDQPIELELRGF